MANDRPPIVGTVGRNSGQIRMKVCVNTQQITIQPQVEVTTLPTTTCADYAYLFRNIKF